MPAAELEIEGEVYRRLSRHVIRARPFEVCGLLAGPPGRASTLCPVRNVAPDPRVGFVMAPRGLLAALLAIDAAGQQLVAIFHSHPPGARRDPSPTDLHYAALYPGVLHLIMVPSCAGRVASARLFSVEDGQVGECPLVVVRARNPAGLRGF